MSSQHVQGRVKATDNEGGCVMTVKGVERVRVKMRGGNGTECTDEG